MIAPPPRQRTIIRDQKYPSDYKGPYHREALEVISSCLGNGLTDLSSLDRQISILRQKVPATPQAQIRINTNIEAIEAFENMLDEIRLDGLDLSLAPNSAPPLIIRNVEISVRPEIVVHAKGKSGAFKIHLSKTFSLDEKAAGYISALMQEWCTQNSYDVGPPDGNLCRVLDIGSRRFYPGVKSTRRRIQDIEQACETIATLWPTI
jgi:hypothetical protein